MAASEYVPSSQPQHHRHGCLTGLNNAIVGPMERAFYRYGRTIARTPSLFILFCIIITAFCCIGITKFKQENNPYKLWVPQESEFQEVVQWKDDNFPVKLRTNFAIFEAKNVLEKDVLLEILRVHDVVSETKADLVTWEDVCAKVPTLSLAPFGRKKRRGADYFESNAGETNGKYPFSAHARYVRQAAAAGDDDDDFGIDWSILLPRENYCNFLEALNEACFETSILDVFGYDREFISSLTQEQILEEINAVEVSAITGFPINVTEILAKVERDADGRIIKAGATKHIWMTQINRTAISRGDYHDDAGTGSQVDAASFDWEQKFIENLLNTTERPSDITTYLMGSTSFGSVSKANIENDLKYLSLGFGVVFIYIVTMLGKFNMVEQRPVLSLLGLTCVGLAVGVSYGICSGIGIPYGPVNSILPFLLLGLGVDDMFVIMQAWNNLTPLEQQQELPERVGCALKHAGVSITVTSMTDFSAFAIGCTTLLPALRAFCIYAAVGIASVYFFQATFFVACLTIDQRRLEANRHGLFCCWKIKNWTPNQCSQRNLCQEFFSEVYAKFLLLLPVKIIVTVFTLALVGVSGWGVSNLQQEFDPIWFLPQDSYLYKFFMKNNEYYPSSGADGVIYFGKTNLLTELPKIEELIGLLRSSEYISEVDSWYEKYKQYWTKQDYEVPGVNQTEVEFLDQLSQFLHSPSGSLYRKRDFRFSSDLNCTQKAPPVTASAINYKHIQMSRSAEEVRAMDSVRELVRSVNFSGFVRAWSQQYGEWETNKVIEDELYRNMGLAVAVVAVVTMVLIASIVTSLLVVLCVLLTLVDVGALMYWWGLTIDTVSCVDLVLAIGLCVDYSAHIGHTFMTRVGTRDERARSTLAAIGPAVLNGGFTTFLSFVFLANSGSHVFITFFKVFFAVSVYGLYHGLVFLPVMLSLLGPASYSTVTPLPPTPASTPATSTTTTPMREKYDAYHEPLVENKHGMIIEKLVENKNTNAAVANGTQDYNSLNQGGIFTMAPGVAQPDLNKLQEDDMV